MGSPRPGRPSPRRRAAEMAASAAAPALTAGAAVASAFGHQARVAQMTEALVAARGILAGLQHPADHQVERVLGLVDAALSASPVTEVRYRRLVVHHDPPPLSTRDCGLPLPHTR